MKTVNSIEKYIINNFAMKNFDLIELDQDIFDDFKNDFNEAKSITILLLEISPRRYRRGL
ncbi:hypothetical protein [Providencia sp. Me31A]|uniref:hypothetical protein n=1 Tax=Providencia sp. Me31A TaxID=3392637 RepID=UPI003D2C1BF3